MKRTALLVLLAGCNGLIGETGLQTPHDSGTQPVIDSGMGAPEDSGTGSDAGQSVDAGTDAGTVIADAGFDAGTSVPDAGPDVCGNAKLCEQFEGYDAGNLVNNRTFGPWRVNVQSGGSISLDSTRSTSGTRALKIHVDQGASAGGQLRTKSAPLFASGRTQLYGRFMMYMQNDGSSVHWTMFGASGTVPAGSSPAAGHHTTYLYSAFANNNGKNIFSDVFYDDQTAQDCYNGSSQLIPVGRWACVAFAVDSAAITYRFWLDGVLVPSMSINTTGQGCVAHPGATPWYGPVFDELYIGALSFHPMSGPLDMWVDDLVVDTVPVSCP